MTKWEDNNKKKETGANEMRSEDQSYKGDISRGGTEEVQEEE